MTVPTLDDAMRLMRRLQRLQERRCGRPQGTVALPELDELDLPILTPDSAPAALPAGRERDALDYYRPDGSLIDLPHPDNALAAAQIPMADKIIARSVRHRHGILLRISTVFLDSDHNGDGPPLLWETMVFHGGTRRHYGKPMQGWRYASRAAALAGHRQVVHTLDTAQRARRKAQGPRRWLAYPPGLQRDLAMPGPPPEQLSAWLDSLA